MSLISAGSISLDSTFKYAKKKFFCILKVTEDFGIDPDMGPFPDPHPDPLVRGTDPRIRIRFRIRIRMLRIRNGTLLFCLLSKTKRADYKTRIFQGLKVCYGFDAGDASRHPVEPLLCGLQVSVHPPHSGQRRIHAPGCEHSSRVSGTLQYSLCFVFNMLSYVSCSPT